MSSRRWATAGGLALLLAAAGAVGATTPTETQWEQPFRVSAPLGERAEGRDIVATIHGARLADEIDDVQWSSGEGSLWLVVDAGVASVTRVNAVRYAELAVGDRTFAASDRPQADTLAQQAIMAGIPKRGALVFELPAAILDDPAATRAEMLLGINQDPRLDSVLVTPLDLTVLDRSASLTIDDFEDGRG